MTTTRISKAEAAARFPRALEQAVTIEGSNSSTRTSLPAQPSRSAVGPSFPIAGTRSETKLPGRVKAASSPNAAPLSPELPAYVGLKFAAQILDDLENVRIANANRLRQLTRNEPDEDGDVRGFGLPENNPTVITLTAMVDALEKLEKDATKEVERLMKRHPLGPWMKAQTGIGFKQGARLLAAIGDPYMRPRLEREDGTVEESRPRLVSELWAYSGYSVINGESQRRRRGQPSNWSDDARKRAYLISASCVKQRPGTPWRDLYDQSRAKYADSVHATDCVRCGPAGRPAKAGTPLSAGHQHARALRIMSKELLKQMWLESKRLHEEN